MAKFAEINLVPVQSSDIGLRAARFPQHLVVELPLQRWLPLHDPAVLLLRDGRELPAPNLGPRRIRHDRHQQPPEMQGVVVQSA